MAKRVRTKLGESSSVTEAIYDAGFNSNSRFYETSNQILGMTPSEFRAGGSDTDMSFAVGECSLGSILVATSKKGVCSILLGSDPARLVRDLQDQFPKANLTGNEKRYEALVAKVVGLWSSRAWVLIYHSISAVLRFSSGYGRRCGRFQLVGLRATR